MSPKPGAAALLLSFAFGAASALVVIGLSTRGPAPIAAEAADPARHSVPVEPLAAARRGIARGLEE